MEEIDLEGGLTLCLGAALEQACVLREQLAAEGAPAIGASVVVDLLADALVWAERYRAWRDAQWEQGESFSEFQPAEDALDEYLRG